MKAKNVLIAAAVLTALAAPSAALADYTDYVPGVGVVKVSYVSGSGENIVLNVTAPNGKVYAVSGYIDEKLEQYYEVPSDKIPFDQAPKMKAYEITEKVIEYLKSGEYKFGRLNFANGDMVGHTGIMEAAITAVETVDECVGKLLKVVEELDGIAVVTADHGNADEMFTVSKGKKSVKTAHTLNPVPFFIVDKNYNGEYVMADVENPGLTNIAGTLLNLLGYENVEDYDKSLIKFV
jgi:2,3-bisphosphoglycerate-independent phosphoglycerate mutase